MDLCHLLLYTDYRFGELNNLSFIHFKKFKGQESKGLIYPFLYMQKVFRCS